VGEARCAECHRAIYQCTLASRHARTLITGEQLSSVPLPDQPLPDANQPRASHSLNWKEGRIHVESRLDAAVFRAVVDYAIGATDRYTSFIGRDEQGRERTLRMSRYKDDHGFGWDRTKNLLAHPAKADDLLGEPLDPAEGARECLSCHTTTVRSVRKGAGPEAHDRGIGCERCHGPGELHLEAIRSRFADPVIAAPTHAATSAVNQLCGRCHAQHFLAMPPSLADPAWARFPSSTLPWSRCSTESGGALSCVTCHDPHKDAETLASHYETKCLSCHASSAPRAAQETQGFRSPCPVSPARNCLSCHMPKVPSSQLHTSFTDHYIRVPSSGTKAGK
jgi:hypothetical protein